MIVRTATVPQAKHRAGLPVVYATYACRLTVSCLQGATPRTPQNESEAVNALELIFSKAANADSNKGTADTETAKVHH